LKHIAILSGKGISIIPCYRLWSKNWHSSLYPFAPEWSGWTRGSIYPEPAQRKRPPVTRWPLFFRMNYLAASYELSIACNLC